MEVDHHVGEECGVFAISRRAGSWLARKRWEATGKRVARVLYRGTVALRHRGRQSAGFAYYTEKGPLAVRKLGHVDAPFTDDEKQAVQETLFTAGGEAQHMPHSFADLSYKVRGVQAGIGHVRYTTSGTSGANQAQPMEGDNFYLAFNGNLTNTTEIRKTVEKMGGAHLQLETPVDTELLVKLIDAHMKKIQAGVREDAPLREPLLVTALKHTMAQVQGAYSLVLLSKQGELVAARDHLGYRPLVLGKLGSRQVVASETVALDEAGAKLQREIKPGEIYYVGSNGRAESHRGEKPPGLPPGLAHCLFEYLYFSHYRSKVRVNGRWIPLQKIREKFGASMADAVLARVKRGPDDSLDDVVVVGVPNSGLSAARGLARKAHLTLSVEPEEAKPEYGPIEKRWIALRGPATTDRPSMLKHEKQRTFIGDKAGIVKEVKKAYEVLSEEVRGKRVILVDDSIVRGPTFNKLVTEFASAGASEIHFVSAAPPIVAPCRWGVALDEMKELAAANALTSEGRRAVQSGQIKTPEQATSVLKQAVTKLETDMNDELREKGLPTRVTLTYANIGKLLKIAGLVKGKAADACTHCFTGFSISPPKDAYVEGKIVNKPSQTTQPPLPFSE